jgi:MraZ protein
MFLGTYQHTIDPKGRLFIPAKLRADNESKSGPYVITRGLELCLYIYTPADFNAVVSKLSSLPVKNQQDGRAFKRMLLAGAHEVPLDEMGRILIPKARAEYAALKKDVSILGVGERIELWSAGKWETYSAKASSTFQKMGRQLEI